MISTYTELKVLALALALPEVTDTTAWGNPCLKAHGKMWVWWSPYLDAACFKGDIDERAMLHAADPETFPLHPHYARHGILLVAAGRIDRDWAEARLRRTWEEMAPKRWLRNWQAGQA